MNFLRTISTRRLVAGVAGIFVACAATAAIAVAAVGSGPVPAPASLAEAVHGSLSGSAVTGVSADITFTNNLFTGASIDTSDPLVTGASGRLWATKGHLRIELQSDNGDSQIVVNGGDFWIYDATADTVYEGTLPSDSSTGSTDSQSKTDAIPTVAQIQTSIAKLGEHWNVSTASPTDIGGQPAYSVTLTPTDSGGLFGGVRFGFDAEHAVPLDLAIFSRGSSSPTLELDASSISYGAVAASDFAISPPAGAKVVKVATATHATSDSSSGAAQNDGSAQSGGAERPTVVGSGLNSVIVLRHNATSGSGSSPGSSAIGGSTSSLPTQSVKLNGATGQELATSLGTLLSFTRGGVEYLLAGSVTPATIESVANGL